MMNMIRHDHEEALKRDPTIMTSSTSNFNFAKRVSCASAFSHRLLRRMWAPLKLSDSQFARLVTLLEHSRSRRRGSTRTRSTLLVSSFLHEPLPSLDWPESHKEQRDVCSTW